ncbi:MAG TPA: 50S ribosomal protein L21 [Acidimicrobiia bacterium]|nr:50S ribosomal protein L21 [Acidimicrobiia bacterium]
MTLELSARMSSKTLTAKIEEKTGKPGAKTFAVIATGGKQYKVEKGDVIEVERLGTATGENHTFTPVMLVSRGKVRASAKDLEGATVTAKVVGETKGPKITGFTYKPKSNSRRRWGHRQGLMQIEITDIKVGSSAKDTESGAEKEQE